MRRLIASLGLIVSLINPAIAGDNNIPVNYNDSAEAYELGLQKGIRIGIQFQKEKINRI